MHVPQEALQSMAGLGLSPLSQIPETPYSYLLAKLNDNIRYLKT